MTFFWWWKNAQSWATGDEGSRISEGGADAVAEAREPDMDSCSCERTCWDTDVVRERCRRRVPMGKVDLGRARRPGCSSQLS